MRTTLTLDEDVAARLKAEARRTGRPFNETLNDCLRVGLTLEKQAKTATVFRVRPRDMGLCPGVSLDKISTLLERGGGSAEPAAERPISTVSEMKRIPHFKLIPEPVTEEARRLSGFKWADEAVGKRHQLGGLPSFPVVEDSDWPRCLDCGERMTFYGQLDSINDDICIADAGLISVFVCLDCNEVKARIETG